MGSRCVLMRALEMGQSSMLRGNAFQEGGESNRKGLVLPGPLPGAVGWWGWGCQRIGHCGEEIMKVVRYTYEVRGGLVVLCGWTGVVEMEMGIFSRGRLKMWIFLVRNLGSRMESRWKKFDFVTCRLLVQFRWSCGDNGFGDLVEM